MVIRKIGVIFLAFLVGLFLVTMSWPYLSYQAGDNDVSITGNSIREAVDIFYETSSLNQRIFILSQIFLLIIIVIAAFIVVRKFKTKEKLVKTDYVVKNEERRSRTDLDVLYEMLKRKKEIDLEDVEGAFKVAPDIALGWAKVLENGDLAEVDYPRFGKPVLRLVIEEEKVIHKTVNSKMKVIKNVAKKKKTPRKMLVKKTTKAVKKKKNAKIMKKKKSGSPKKKTVKKNNGRKKK